MAENNKARSGGDRPGPSKTTRREHTEREARFPAVGMDALLSRLEGVRRTGNGTWSARCPAHDDRSASLSVRETDDGKKLLHCFAGCSVHEVVAAVGLELSDLFPPREPGRHSVKPERRPFPAADCLRGVAKESLVVAAIAVDVANTGKLSPADRERLITAAGRIQGALTVSGVAHG